MPESYQVDQALHGYDDGHRLLASSIRLGHEDERALLTMSDLSGSRVVEGFYEYLTGYQLPSGSHYAMAKTWYASEMRRPGCVWTHTLLIPQPTLWEFHAADCLLNCFARPRLDLDFRYSEKITVSEYTLDFRLRLTIAQISGIDAFYESSGPIGIETTSGTECELLLLRLWSQMWPELRQRTSFCTGSLSPRILGGKLLDIQCGPERVIREVQSTRIRQGEPSAWLTAILEDLDHPSDLRKFWRTTEDGSLDRSSTRIVTDVFLGALRANIAETLLDR